MKKTFLKFFAAVLMVGFAAVSVGCKDYDDDIDSLNSAVAGLKTTVDALQAKINEGYLVKDIKSTSEGISIVLSNGQTYTVTNGKDGKPGTTWTIESDGYWYKDGQKTEYKAVAGGNGENGEAGKDGKYYVPNPETGCFDEVDGEEVTPTDIRWRPEGSGLTAVVDGNKLTFSNVATGVEGETTDVVVTLGPNVGSLAINPNYIDEKTGAEVAEFYLVTKYIADAVYYGKEKFDSDRYETAILKNPGDDTSKIPDNFRAWSNVYIDYRVNPTDAYLYGGEFTNVDFLGRGVDTRAVDDSMVGVLTAVDWETVSEGGETVLTVKATPNANYFLPKNVSMSNGNLRTSGTYKIKDGDHTPGRYGEHLLARARGYVGQSQQVVSDEFVDISWDEIPAVVLAAPSTAELAGGDVDNNYKWTMRKAVADYYKTKNTSWTQGTDYAAPTQNADDGLLTVAARGLWMRPFSISATKETSDFVRSIISPTQFDVHMTVRQGETYDLTKYVGAYVLNTKDALEEYGFDVVYKFYKPEEVFSATDEKTNEQVVITSLSEDGIMTIASGESALNRRPVVRVEAEINGKVVATGYMTFQVGRAKVASKTFELDDVVLNYSQIQTTCDGNLTKNPHANKLQVSKEIDAAWINKNLYDALKLSHDAFVTTYDVENPEIQVVTSFTPVAGKTTNAGTYVWTNVYGDKGKVNGIYYYDYATKQWITGSATTKAPKVAQVAMKDIIEVVSKKNAADADQNKRSTIDFSISVTNKAFTELTFDDVDGKGALYAVTVTINPNKGYSQYEPIVFTQNIYVKNDAKPFAVKSNYVTTYNDETAAISVGQLADEKQKSFGWRMSTILEEIYEKANATSKHSKGTKTPVGIFTYPTNNEDNVKGVEFSWHASAFLDNKYWWTDPTKVASESDWKNDQKWPAAKRETVGYFLPDVEVLATPQDATTKIALAAKLERDMTPKDLEYTMTYENAETVLFNTWILFEKPFKAVEPKNPSVNAETGKTLNLAKSVGIQTLGGDPIITWYDEVKADKDGKGAVAEGLYWEKDAARFGYDPETVGPRVDKKLTNARVEITYKLADKEAGVTVDENTGVLTVSKEGAAITKDVQIAVTAHVLFYYIEGSAAVESFCVDVPITVDLKSVHK